MALALDNRNRHLLRRPILLIIQNQCIQQNTKSKNNQKSKKEGMYIVLVVDPKQIWNEYQVASTASSSTTTLHHLRLSSNKDTISITITKPITSRPSIAGTISGATGTPVTLLDKSTCMWRHHNSRGILYASSPLFYLCYTVLSISPSPLPLVFF